MWSEENLTTCATYARDVEDVTTTSLVVTFLGEQKALGLYIF